MNHPWKNSNHIWFEKNKARKEKNRKHQAVISLSRKEKREENKSTFWDASEEEMLDRYIVAAGIGYSSSALCPDMKTKVSAIPFTKVGRRCLYKKKDVLQWMEDNNMSHVLKKSIY